MERSKGTDLGEDITHFQHLELGAPLAMLSLIDSIRHNNLIQRTRIDPVNRVSAQDTVGNKRIHLRRALLLQELGGTSNSIGRIGKIVNEDGGPAADVADKHHGSVLPVRDLRGATLLFCISHPPAGAGLVASGHKPYG